MSTLDDFTREHLRRWLDQYDDAEYREQVRDWIAAALLECPDAIGRGLSWPDLRDIGRRMEMGRVY